MKILLLFISTVFSSAAAGQSYSQGLVDSFCNSTIKYYYTEFAKPIDSTEAANFKPISPFITKSDITKNLRTHYDNFTVCFLTQQEALEKISLTKNRTGSLDKVVVTRLKDTINIVIVGWAITITKVKFLKGRPANIHANFAASCGGTFGYIPTCRFVYDNITNVWTRYTWTQTADGIMSKRRSDNGPD
jgi:hypothetical protein